MKAPPKLTKSINIRRDNHDDHHGWDFHHPYLETFWLPILGPSSTALLRHIGLTQIDDDTPEALNLTVAPTIPAVPSATGVLGPNP